MLIPTPDLQAGIVYRLWGAETGLEIPREYTHAVKLWAMIGRCDGWMEGALLSDFDKDGEHDMHQNQCRSRNSNSKADAPASED